MWTIIAALLLAVSASNPCVIVARHQHKFGENMSRVKPHKALDYVEGDFPAGMKFQSEIGDKQVRQIQESGGKVVVLPPDYKLPDLEDARKSCNGRKP